MKTQFVLLLMIAILMFSCSNDDSKTVTNQELFNDGVVKIELLNINDGRCPSNSVCIWQGNAEVFLRIADQSASIDYSLNTVGINNINQQAHYPNSIQVLNRDVMLLNLQPLPLIDVTYSLSDYTVTLDVQ